MRDIEGRYLSDDVVEAIKSFLLERGCLTLNGVPNITNIHFSDGLYKTEYTEPAKDVQGYLEIPEHWTNIHFSDGLYKTEYTEPAKDVQGYLEIPEHWIKSFIRNKKINKIIE